MAIEYLGLSSVEGPLVVLEGVQDAFYDEIDGTSDGGYCITGNAWKNL